MDVDELPPFSPWPTHVERLAGPRRRRIPGRLVWEEGAAGLSEAARARLEAHLTRRRLLGEGSAPALRLVTRALSLPGACRFELGREARLEAGDEAGFHRAVELLAAAAEAPPLLIEDQPRLAWRGLMLDCSRHFWPASLLERVLDEVAASGGNRLHLHLSDDQGWRLPLPGRPELDTPGGGQCNYTASELKSLVELGLELGVEILPEVDLPGHCGALLAALPGLSCDGLERKVPTTWGCHEALLCLGRPQALAFLEEVLDVLRGIFPFPVVHLGGDEIPARVWGRCPRCLELARRAGLDGVSGLPGWWLNEAGRLLAQAGRRGAFWDEALEGPAPQGALIFAWRGTEAVRRSLAAGHETVACPQRPCYLDHYPGPEEGQVLAIGGLNTWQDLRAFDPGAGVDPATMSLLLGGQGNLWTEYVDHPDLMMERLQPRLSALFEALWRGPEAGGAPGFALRLPALLARRWTQGWRPRVEPPEITGPPVALQGEPLELVLCVGLPGAGLRVELDGQPVDQVHRLLPGGVSARFSKGPVGASLCVRPASGHDASCPDGETRKLRLEVIQEIPGLPATRHVRELRWEAARPARHDAPVGDEPPVRCRWLAAREADWRTVWEPAICPEWHATSLDWPADLVEGQVEQPLPPLNREIQEAGVPAGPGLPALAPAPSGWGLRRRAMLFVPSTGVWTFHLRTPDRARLWLDGELLIDQDGFRPAGLLEGHMALAAGPHILQLDWLHLRGGACQLTCHGPQEGHEHVLDALLRPAAK